MRKIFMALLVCSAILSACNEEISSETLTNKIKEEVVEVFNFHFDIVPDTLFGETKQVKRNQFLSDLLSPYNISPVQVHKLVQVCDTVFDVRKIRSGNNYTIFTEKEKSLKYFCYEINMLEYIVFDFTDSVKVYRGKKELKHQHREVSGVINSSLYETIQEQGVSPILAQKLADVYAWTIDFYSIQKGDYFKVVFTEEMVEDKIYGISNIECSFFNHKGRDFYAFEFYQGEEMDYFDVDGNSLRRAFLRSPLQFGRISSHYTMRRYHPVQKRMKAHLGTDYAAPRGTPILATGSGTVIEAKRSRYNGKYVKIKHNNTFTTQYLHMSGFARGMHSGKYVQQGDIIGYVGSTGLATGPHVCYRFWKQGKQVNHLREDFPPDKPILDSLRPAFNLHRDSLVKKLDALPNPTQEEEVTA